MKTISLIAALSFVSLTLSRPSNATHSIADTSVVHVTSSKDFCLFLPPVSHTKTATDLGLDAKKATSVCRSGNTTFSPHLISSAHYKKTKDYVQITGKLNLKGGYTGFQQFDDSLPKKSQCKGYKSFISLIDAEEGYYCLRCCNDNSCPTTEASLGCQDIIPGKY
ncbi:hypothetical protein INT43_002049 [Umbelopsis isabellina]|uniref:Uncharacterized protein n=1 Tax=Mortierella isabellina TaxID=91625 RepID=A0A8H7UHD0_MORIS|nr:hypothetical protein INT43_002049 [Umbelopsis isabellina]